MLDDNGTESIFASALKKSKVSSPSATSSSSKLVSSEKGDGVSPPNQPDASVKAASDLIVDNTLADDDTSSPHPPANHDNRDISAAKKNLSNLRHKKRALKAPRSLFKNDNNRGQKLVLSEFEKEVYYVATKRIKLGQPNPYCAQIGRMSINESDFGESMRPKTWVGTFVMNVYCEAIAYDHNKELPPKKKKGFLTSAEVDNLNVNGIDVELLKKKLVINFELHKVDMNQRGGEPSY